MLDEWLQLGRKSKETDLVYEGEAKCGYGSTFVERQELLRVHGEGSTPKIGMHQVPEAAKATLFIVHTITVEQLRVLRICFEKPSEICFSFVEDEFC